VWTEPGAILHRVKSAVNPGIGEGASPSLTGG